MKEQTLIKLKLTALLSDEDLKQITGGQGASGSFVVIEDLEGI